MVLFAHKYYAVGCIVSLHKYKLIMKFGQFRVDIVVVKDRNVFMFRKCQIRRLTRLRITFTRSESELTSADSALAQLLAYTTTIS